jgi:N-sulfoglucosamine sulfohydrolase
MSHRFISILILAWFGFISATAGAVGRPNLLLITVDDMSADSVGVFGSSVPAITPNIDQLAREGLRFGLAHVQVANCMPSRNVMWSGRYPQSNKVEGFYQVSDPGYPTLANLAKKEGYFTAIRHKVKDSTPYYPYEWDLVLDDVPGSVKLYAKDAKSYGLSTIQGIRSAKSVGKPFYLLINVADPHVPFFGLNKAGKDVDDGFPPSRLYGAQEISVPGFLTDDLVVRQELAHYYSSVRRADDAVGQILRALKESGEADNTLVMLISDHGMPFPFAKTQLYHQSTRTPLIFRWPGVVKKDSVDSKHMVSAVDIMPTLLEVIGAEIPLGVDGRTLLPLLKGGSQGDRDMVFKAHNENSSGQRNPMRAVESRHFLYIFNPWSDGSRAMFSATNETRTHKRMTELARDNLQIASRLNLLKHRVLEEFYDIQKDPDCLVNLIADPAYQHEVETLRDALEEWLRDMQDPTLAAFLGRQDPKVLAAYMREQQLASKKRRELNRAIWNRAIEEKLQKMGEPSKAEQ